MADTVDITAGVGTKISTEDVTTLNGGAVSAQHVQRIAAAIRTADGAAVDLPGSTADGLLVNLGANNDVTVTGALPAGGNTIGNVGVAGGSVGLLAGAANIGTVTLHPTPEAPVTVNATASGNTTVIAAPGASLSLYICKASVHNRDAANVVVALQDGAGGTSRWRAELAAEGGGALIDFGARGWKLTANTLLNVNLSAVGSVDVNVTDFYIAA